MNINPINEVNVLGSGSTYNNSYTKDQSDARYATMDTQTAVQANSALWESLSFQDNLYLTYDGVSGTQSGTLGAYLSSSGTNASTGFALLNINGSNVSITQRNYARGNQANTESLAVSYVANLTAGQIVKARAQYATGALTLDNIILNIVKI